MAQKDRQRDWVREEVVVLVAEYYRTKGLKNHELKSSYENVCRILQKREIILTGKMISPIFRNYNGIKMQFSRIRCIDAETKYSGMIGTKLQKEVVKEYLVNPDKFFKEAEDIVKHYENIGI